MFQFEKISVKQILVFCEIINESSLLQKEFIEEKYLRSAPNFGETGEFLQELDLIETREDQIVLRPRYKTFLEELKKTQQPEQITKKFIVNYLLNHRTSFSEYLDEFLSRFRLTNEQWQFTPSAPERLKYSGLRNFLIDLEFLYLDLGETKYIIADDYSLLYIELKESHRLSPDELLKVQQKKEEIGKAAELEIIKYEKERLSQFPHLAEKIEYMAIKDVMAGYDIKSFDDKLTENGNPIPRFIEVKAVSPWNYRFNWTRNEIEKSKLYHQNYYLYLLPAIGNNKFDLKGLRIIRDPYSNIYKNENEWIRTDELVSFSLFKDSNKSYPQNMDK